jgi:hypothetical protein
VFNGVRPNPAQENGQVGTINFPENVPETTLGLGEDGLAFYFSCRYTDALLGNGATAAVQRGQDWFLKLRATVDVQYNATQTSGTTRRRRQVTFFWL